MKTFREFITEVYDKMSWDPLRFAAKVKVGGLVLNVRNQTRNAPHETNRRG